MFNIKGEVIGIVSHIISKSGGSEGLGFVVTINTARELLLERRAFWSGLEFVALTARQAAALNLPQPGGLLVKAVARGSPAAAAGLRAGTVPGTIDGTSMPLGGDIILSVGGIPVTEPGSAQKIRELLTTAPSGSTVSAKVMRLGTLVDVEVLIQ